MATKSPLVYQQYCNVRNNLRYKTSSLRRNYEYKLASNCNVNVKQFCKYVNSCLKTHPSISALKQPDNSVTHSDQEKSELFNDFFGVFTKETPLSSCSFHLDSDVLPLTNITITPDVVYDKLVHLDPSKAPGPEGWPVLSFKENAHNYVFHYQYCSLNP